MNVDTEVQRQREIVAQLQNELAQAPDPRAAVELADALRTALEGLRTLAEIADLGGE